MDLFSLWGLSAFKNCPHLHTCSVYECMNKDRKERQTKLQVTSFLKTSHICRHCWTFFIISLTLLDFPEFGLCANVADWFPSADSQRELNGHLCDKNRLSAGFFWKYAASVTLISSRVIKIGLILHKTFHIIDPTQGWFYYKFQEVTLTH